MREYAPAERFARLRLARTDGIGAVGFGRLLAAYGSGAGAVHALLGQGKPLAGAEATGAEMARVAQIGARYLFLGEAAYPPRLAAVHGPPPVLVAAGDPALAARPVVAIVGARNASAAGLALARTLAEGLSEAGVVVVSGMARGIDGAAHRASLKGGTIACVAGGIDVPYPPENTDLQWQVAQEGLLVSEAPPRTEPIARRFPRRNRLIAGMALAVVVVEGAVGSGSLITARMAAEEGREVLAVPGHPGDPRSGGGNALIKEGALLVENVGDVLQALEGALPPVHPGALPAVFAPVAAPVAAPSAPVAGPEMMAGDGALLALLGMSPTPVDELVRLLGLPVAQVQAQLSTLEIEGQVERLSGGRVRLAVR